MCEKNEHLNIFLGYTVMALKELGYSETNVKDIITKIETMKSYIRAAEAAETLNDFLDDSTKQVIIEDYYIPTEYNMVKISDLLNGYEFTDEKTKSSCSRVYKAFSYRQIVYIKDLYGKNRSDLTRIHNVTDKSFDLFIQTLKQIFKNLNNQ